MYQGSIYNLDVDQVTGGSLDIEAFNDTINMVSDDSENLRKRFEEGNMWSNIAGIIVSGIFDIAKSMVVMIITPFTLISNIMVNTLGIPSIVMNIILGVLILSVIFGIWRILKVGD